MYAILFCLGILCCTYEALRCLLKLLDCVTTVDMGPWPFSTNHSDSDSDSDSLPPHLPHLTSDPDITGMVD